MRIRLAAFTLVIGLLFGVGTARGQSISGTLTDAATGLPLGNLLTFAYGVQVFDANGHFVDTVFTLSNGTHWIEVPAGKYSALRPPAGHRAVALPDCVGGVDIGRRSASLDLLPAGTDDTRRLTLSPAGRSSWPSSLWLLLAAPRPGPVIMS